MIEVHFRADLQSEQYPENDHTALAQNIAGMFHRVETAILEEIMHLEASSLEPTLKNAARSSYQEELRAFRLLYHNFSVEVK